MYVYSVCYVYGLSVVRTCGCNLYLCMTYACGRMYALYVYVYLRSLYRFVGLLSVWPRSKRWSTGPRFVIFFSEVTKSEIRKTFISPIRIRDIHSRLNFWSGKIKRCFISDDKRVGVFLYWLGMVQNLTKRSIHRTFVRRDNGRTKNIIVAQNLNRV